MNLKDRLLAHFQTPGYKPANELALSRQLGLNKKQRNSLAFEVRRLLATGQIVRLQGDRLKISTEKTVPSRGTTAKPGKSAPVTATRPIFQVGQSRGIQTKTSLAPATSSQAEAPSPRPQSDDGLTGRIHFRSGGSAFVVLDKDAAGDPDQAAIQISPDDTDVALHGDHVMVQIMKGVRTRRPGEQAGRVVHVLERARDTIVGDLQKVTRRFVVHADDPRFAHEVIVDDPAGTAIKPAPMSGDKVVVRLNSWKRRQDPLTGVITARLGRTHEPRAELLGIYEKFNLATQFPAEVEAEVAGLPDKVSSKQIGHRLDYRDKAVFTIDPDDAKDFDDALSIETLENGDIKIGIHIADVSYYVKPGTALDREAQTRGNSTYLVGVVIPMLPEKLSNGLCSLVEAQDRLTKAVFLTFGPKSGKVKETSYANTVIRSRKRLTYKQAYAFLKEDSLEKIRALPLPPKHQTGSTGRALNELSEKELIDLQTWIRQLWTIGSKLRKARMENGSLDLDMPETKIFVDQEGYADRLEKVLHDESHQLIEEFMLAANEAVARLTRTSKLPSLYRVHDEPDGEKLDDLRQLLVTYNIQVSDLTKREELIRLLKLLETHPQGYTLRTQVLRSLKKAAYRASPDGHFGLAKKDYTHFTSPIRRYSDLVVHRVFDIYLAKHQGYPSGGADLGYTLLKMESLGEHLSVTEINSAEAERESVKIKLLEFFERELEKKVKTRFAAVITDVRPNGFFVELIESMTFGFVPASALQDDYYTASNDGSALVGRKRKKRFETNGRLDLIVIKVDRFKRTIDFAPAP